jgi:hypothetical protein
VTPEIAGVTEKTNLILLADPLDRIGLFVWRGELPRGDGDE